MCAVSNMGDYWRDAIPTPWVTPAQPAGGAGTVPVIVKQWDEQSFKMLEELLRLTKKLDEKMDQKDCENDDKMAYFKKVAEHLGVTFDIEEKKTGLTFGEALEVVKADTERKVARSGWNGKGMYIFLQKDVGEGWNDYLVMKTADGMMQPGWLASQTDMLSNDWMIVE
jgi:hypothetical protein